jgi:hypothetical protein
MPSPSVEWLEGDPFWPRLGHLLMGVLVAVGALETVAVLQFAGVVRLLPYSLVSPTGQLVELGLDGLVILNAVVRLRFPTAGPVGLAPDVLVLRGYFRRWNIPRSRILRVEPRGVVLRRWWSGRLPLTVGQSERVARWFYAPSSDGPRIASLPPAGSPSSAT